jgi:hypothetical protein
MSVLILLKERQKDKFTQLTDTILRKEQFGTPN